MEIIKEISKKRNQIRIGKGAEKNKFLIKENRTTKKSDIQVNKHLKNNRNIKGKPIEKTIKK
jgi:hypothetical protein